MSNSQEFVFLHIETTGLNPEYGDTITELGALRCTHATLHGQATEVSAIKISIDAENTIAAALTSLAEFAEGAPIVCYYAPFHMGFIHAACEQSGVQVTNDWLCAQELAKDTLHGLPSYKLVDITNKATIPAGLTGTLEKCYRCMLVFGACQ